MDATPSDRSPSATALGQSPRSTALPPETLSEHLSYPTPSEPSAPVASSSTSAQARPLLKDRLYVGNLHSSVDEYTLLQIFSKFGKISKLDYLFHKSGPLKGKPRGYAFVEFADKADADKALTHAHDKLLRGRKLVVTYANQAPLDSSNAPGAGAKNRRAISEVGKPTTLSLLKSAGTGRSDATDAKIARMEAKLRQLEDSASLGPAAAGGSLPAHPSLPPKPVAATAAAAVASPRHGPTSLASGSASGARERRRVPPPQLPSLPIKPSTQPSDKSAIAPRIAAATPSPARVQSIKKPALSGVRLVKPKSTSSTG